MKEKTLSEKILEYLKSGSYMYASLINVESTSPAPASGNDNPHFFKNKSSFFFLFRSEATFRLFSHIWEFLDYVIWN